MLKAITRAAPIRKAQKELADRLSTALPVRASTYTIGFQGGNFNVDNLRANDRIWCVHQVHKEEPNPNYWNAFGLAEQLHVPRILLQLRLTSHIKVSECHHIFWLSEGGDDTIANTVALCPNCHRKMHVVCVDADVSRLKKKAKRTS